MLNGYFNVSGVQIVLALRSQVYEYYLLWVFWSLRVLSQKQKI